MPGPVRSNPTFVSVAEKPEKVAEKPAAPKAADATTAPRVWSPAHKKHHTHKHHAHTSHATPAAKASPGAKAPTPAKATASTKTAAPPPPNVTPPSVQTGSTTAVVLAPPPTNPPPASSAPTFSLSQLMLAAGKRMSIDALPKNESVRNAAGMADSIFGNKDGNLDSDELYAFEHRTNAYTDARPVLEQALQTQGVSVANPEAPPPAGSPVMGARIDSLPADLRGNAAFADSNGNHDGVLDSREIAEDALGRARKLGGAALPTPTMEMYRRMYRATNAGTAIPGSSMRADGLGASPNWPPPVQRQVIAPSDVTAERLGLAQRIVKPAGTATQEDVAAVTEEVARLPMAMLRALDAKHVPIRVARDSVVDAEPSLKAEQPRGWHEGETFGDVPGVYHPESKSVILATEPDGQGGRRLATDDGSLEMVAHEVGHAIDALDLFNVTKGAVVDSPEFKAAYEADLPNLKRLGRDYLTQDGRGGLEEAFAEELAAYVIGDQFMPENTPHLRAFYDNLFAKTEQ